MRNFLTLALFLAAFAAPVAGHAAAEGAAPAAPTETRIAVVDLQGLVSESKAGKSIQAQIKKQRESFQTQFSALEKELADMQKKLSDEKLDKNSKEFEEKRKAFESKMTDANKQVQQRRQALEKGAADAVLELRKEIVKIVADVADQEKLTLVIGRNDVILVDKTMDISERVLAILDKNLPNVKVDMASAEAPKKK